MIAYNGLEKLYSLFNRADISKEMRDQVAICIGRFFRAQIIQDAFRTLIIDSLKEFIRDQDEWIRAESVIALSYLANIQHVKYISWITCTDCSMTKKMKKFADRLLTMEFSILISSYLTLEICNQSYNNVILYAINQIFNILGFGAKQASSSSQYPHFETISAYGGVDKLYSVFERNDVNKKVKGKATICISKLYRSKVLDEKMRTDIILHLKTHINDSDNGTKINSISALNGLALIQEAMPAEYTAFCEKFTKGVNDSF
ncbi:MAG: hypothetical protein EZS28_012999 [Streblomastix strix]|uniref:Condensin complex subunit 1 C-terminal domain-containing protein n=1 Tax=Streblomastix strix TaxID=222440 RepID=A0A5J4WAT0_9EUKA|nr:MAG: hypothetical protein EZS28_012999 [Streblomastix strix]